MEVVRIDIIQLNYFKSSNLLVFLHNKLTREKEEGYNYSSIERLIFH
jgi:hypothetical protein